MSTKVKGQAIKEGSIPLGALSEEIKNKIENAGGGATPDWNAQEGESGYIENRTHFFKWFDKPEDKNFNDLLLGLKDKTPISVTEDGYIKTVKYLANECHPMWEQGFEYFVKNWEAYSNDILGGLITVPDISAGDVSPKISTSNEYDDDGNDITYVTIQWKTEEISDVNKVIDQICLGHYVIPYHNYDIWQLNDKYIQSNIARKSDIPKDIIKTTPQELSDTDKNQALANLGIDMFANYKNLGGRFFDTPELYYKYKSLDREIAINFSYSYFNYSGVIDENHRIILIYGIREGVITEIHLNEGIGNHGGDFETFKIDGCYKNNSGEFVIKSEMYDDEYIYELSININSGAYELKYVQDI